MHLNTILFASLLATHVSSTPVPVDERSIQKRSFKLDRIRNAHFTGHNGPRAMIKAYRKYGMPLPQGLLDAMAKQKGHKPVASAVEASAKSKASGQKTKSIKPNVSSGVFFAGGNRTDPSDRNGTAQAGTGKVANKPIGNDVEYVSPIKIGDQTINVVFDTGSSDLWVFSTQLNDRLSDGHEVFDPTKSETFSEAAGSTFKITYGDGSGASGIVGTDVVGVGGATVTQQAVGLATAVSDQFVEDQDNHGLLGLAFSPLNTVKPKKVKTFFDNIMPSLPEPLFTADLRPQAAGSYEFGRIDSSKFTGELTWIPVDSSQGHWQFVSETFAVGDGEVQKGQAGAPAIVDTGTTLILAAPETVKGYYSQVEGAVENERIGGVVFPCDTELPDLMLDVGGVYMARVKGEHIRFTPVDDENCFGGLQAGDGLQVYGDIFFKSQFTVFHGGNETIGLADHA